MLARCFAHTIAADGIFCVAVHSGGPLPSGGYADGWKTTALWRRSTSRRARAGSPNPDRTGSIGA